MEDAIELSKKTAAIKAVDYIGDGMVVGLGTGSTAEYAIREIAKRISAKRLSDIVGIPTSKRTEKLAEELGISLGSLDKFDSIDVDIDGADEVDSDFNLIKGGGGAHTMEKRVAVKSRQFIVVVDHSKMVKKLGKFPVAVEVIPQWVESVTEELRRMGGRPELRENFKTDLGNIILDTKFDRIDAEMMENRINLIDGVVDNGIFSRRKPEIVIVGNGSNLKILMKNGKEGKATGVAEDFN